MAKKKIKAADTLTVEDMDNIATSYGNDDEKPLTAEEQRELQVRQAMRLRLKGLTLVDISKYMGLTYDNIRTLITEANAQLRSEVQDFDYPLFIGDSIAFFNEIRDSNMALANSNAAATPAMKTLCMRTAMQAETSKHNFLGKVGLFSRPSNSGVFEPEVKEEKETTDADDFQEFLKDIAEASGRLIELDAPEEEGD